MDHTMKKIILIALSLSLFGCLASTTIQQAPIGNINDLQEGHALIIVERKKEANAQATAAEISDGNNIIGELGVGAGRDINRLIWERPAGPMSLSIKPSGLVIGDLPPLETNTEAGKTYAYIVKWSYGKYSLIMEEQ